MIYNDNYKIMITGAGGFLGNELLNQLSKDPKYKIIALTSKEDKIYRRFSNNKSIICYNLYDINNRSIPWSDIDIIIHCAFARSQEGYFLAKSLNITQEIFSKACKNNVKGLINISSQGVYGQSNKPLWKETTKVAPDSLYALAKYSTELFAKNIMHLGACETTITSIRLPGLTGGCEGLKLEIVSRFVNNVINGESINIVGGRQIFSNMHVRDAAEGIIKLMGIKPSRWRETYNLGNEWRCNIIEIAETVKRIAPEYTSNPVSIEIEEKDVHINSGMDSSLFYKDTGWKPKYDMDAIVRSLFEYFTNS